MSEPVTEYRLVPNKARVQSSGPEFIRNNLLREKRSNFDTCKRKTSSFAVGSMLQRLFIPRLLVKKFGLNQLITSSADLRLNKWIRGLSTGSMASNGPCSADEKFNLITRNLQVRT